MSVLASSGTRLASEICWLASGYDGCFILAGAGYPVIIYETLPLETVKEVAEKVQIAKKEEKAIPPEKLDAIIDEMVDKWAKKDMEQKMREFRQTKEAAIESYRQTLLMLIQEEELALILILASI